MDLQKKNDESMPQSEKSELPINIIDLIITNELEKDSKSEIEAKITENEDNTHTEAKQTNGQTILITEEENIKENKDDIVKDISGNEKVEIKIETTDNVRQDEIGNANEKRVDNGIFTDDSAGKSLELLWAEAIKAQNEGRYKDAIRNFTEIYEVIIFCF